MTLVSIALGIVFFGVLIWLVNKVFDILITAIIKSTKSNLDNKLAPIIRRTLTIVLLITGLYFITTFIRFDGPIHVFISKIYISGIAIMLAIVVGEIINIVMHTVLYGRFKGSKESLNAMLPFINNISRVIIFSVVGLFVMSLFKIDITPALASAGVIGVAFAFAAKDFVANLFGGVSVFFDKPYLVGDYVIIADKYRGEVVEIGMRSTRIKTRDDVLLTIPNSVMTTNAVINETGFDPRLRIRISMQIDYSEDLQNVENALLELAHNHNEVLNDPPPIVRYREFAESGINVELLVMIAQPSEKGRIIHEVIKHIHQRFKVQHIHIPYPQRVIHIKNER